MTAASPAEQVFEAELKTQLREALSWVRCARKAAPDHVVASCNPGSGCELCLAERRLNWLIEQIPRHAQ